MNLSKRSFLTLACSGALALSLIAGCVPVSPTAKAQDEAQAANRAYMSSVNETMSDLDKGLEEFVTAVSRNDVVTMQTKAERAYKAIDKLKETDAPEALADIKNDYVEGATKLQEALNDYIALYTEMQAAQSTGSFDFSTFGTRVAGVQQKYDEGVAALKKADEAAADLQ